MNQYIFLYFGKSGGGLELFENLNKSLPNENVTFICKPKVSRNLNLHLHRSYLGIFRQLIGTFGAGRKSIYIFTMMSPYDWFLLPILILFRKKIVTMVHDYRSHEGETYPWHFDITLRKFFSNGLICFTNFVAINLNRRHKTSIWPYYTVPIQPRSHENLGNLLLIGRGYSYQNFEIVNELVGIMPSRKWEVVVTKNDKLEFNTHPNLEINIGWLSENELNEKIAKSSMVILPYKSATQSGIIRKALLAGVPCIVTPVGGLPEQIVNHESGAVSSSISANSIIQTINEFERKKQQTSNYKIYLDSTVNLLTTLDRYLES